MLKIKNVSTYTKTLLMILVSSLAFILLFLTLYFYTFSQEKEVREVSIKQYKNEIHTLLQLNSESHFATITDITYWDELVSFVKSKDIKWFNQSIAPSLTVFNADYFGVFDLNEKLIKDATTNKVSTINLIPKEVFLKLYKKKLVKFYMKTPEGIVEVFGATIHPSNDPLKNKTKPSGYFFMATLLDANYFKQLEKIMSSKISVDNNISVSKLSNDDDIAVNFNLYNSNNQIVSQLVFQRPFTINFKVTRMFLIIIIIAFIVNLIINLLYSRKWIFSPLNLITRILETGNNKAITILKNIPGEFGYIGNLFNENISQRKLLEKSKAKAEESDKLKSAFLANLSHEIRTPMNAIIGFTDLLKNSKLSEKEKLEYLNVIQLSGNNLISIIDDLIEMSKIDSNLIQPNYTYFNLNDCADELYNSLKVTIPKDKNIEFKLEVKNKKFSGKILSDKVKLKQIITNLITNAIKFTVKGYVHFECNIDEENSKIHFIVSDTGIGVDEKEQKVIFDRFRRVDSEYAVKVGGLGLGLAISKAYVEMLGGNMTMHSKLGEGSVFEFYIPLQIAPIEEIEEEVKSKFQKTYKKENKCILIAEDDNINYLLIEKIMLLKNFQIIRAKDGQEAVDICLTNTSIDLVLMDIKMPKLNGYEAIEKIKKIQPNLPIIAQTAYSSSEDQEKIRKAGFINCITKPINKEKLFDLISNVLK